MRKTWLKGKQLDPYQRPRIDWWATWKPFIPFWLSVAVIICIICLARG
jgi:hypothetical protein